MEASKSTLLPISGCTGLGSDEASPSRVDNPFNLALPSMRPSTQLPQRREVASMSRVRHSRRTPRTILTQPVSATEVWGNPVHQGDEVATLFDERVATSMPPSIHFFVARERPTLRSLPSALAHQSAYSQELPFTKPSENGRGPCPYDLALIICPQTGNRLIIKSHGASQKVLARLLIRRQFVPTVRPLARQ